MGNQFELLATVSLKTKMVPMMSLVGNFLSTGVKERGLLERHTSDREGRLTSLVPCFHLLFTDKEIIGIRGRKRLLFWRYGKARLIAFMGGGAAF